MKFSWTDPLSIIIRQLSLYYRKLEDFWTKDEPNEGMKVKMRIAIFVSHLLFGFFTVLPFINPFFSPPKAIFALICVSGYFIILRRKNRSFLVFYFLINAVFTLFMSSKSYIEMFRIITVILAQHNHSVLMVNNKTLSFMLMGITLFFVSKSQANMNHLIEEQEYDKMIEAIRNMQYTWPLTYLFNQIASMHMTTGYCRVIEESQDTQEQLKAKNEELFVVNEKLKTTLSLLEKTNKELKDALSARELFIASVSHELRNPLNSMLGNIELLSLETKDQRWLTMLNTCKICGEVLLGLINNVLDVAKINAERLELNFQPGNLYKLIEKVWVVSTIKMRQQKIKGYLAIGANLPKYVNMDNHRLNQILLNLIGNATKFTKDGFVKVIITWSKNEGADNSEEPSYDYISLVRNKAASHNTIMSQNNLSTNRDLSAETLNITENHVLGEIDLNTSLLGTNEDAVRRVFHTKSLTQLRVRNFIEFDEQDVKIQEKLSAKNPNITRENGILRIEIIDSGCGITESSIQRLFQPFTQADSSITRQYGGTGLGLYITKQLVQKMEGQIHVVSQKNVGSAFWISIPTQSSVEREEDEQNSFKEEHKNQDGNIGEPRVLIVDDDPLNQTIMAHYFKKLNMEPEVAVNGQDAVTRFKSKRPHYYSLITMDIQMPVMDGLTACKEIRKFEQQAKVDKNVPIVIVTGNCIDLDKSQCLDPYGQIRASYFFRKPFKFEECQSCVKALCAKDEEEMQVLRRTQGKVMIVDDDVFNTEILRKYLEKYSFECEICRNGKEAILLAEKQKFRIVLMDCEMPEMDGYTATAHLRAKYPDLVIIGVTGSLKENCMKKAKESGMNDVETKPVNFQRLMKRIRGAYTQR